MAPGLGPRRRIPDDALVVSMFARIEPMKGQVDFVHCMGRLATRHPQLYGVMCGPADKSSTYWRTIERLVDEYGLEDGSSSPVTSGLRSRTTSWRRPAVVVHPSHAESFGLAVLEAMARGAGRASWPPPTAPAS